MSGWLVTGACDLPAWASSAGPLRSGVLAVALAGLPEAPSVLLSANDDGCARNPAQARLWPDPVISHDAASLSVLGGRTTGVTVRLRLGDRVLRHDLPGPVPALAGPLVLRLGWAATAGGGRWWLALEEAGGRPVVTGAAGAGAAPWPAGLVRAVCGGPGLRQRHAGVGACAIRRAVAGPAPEHLAQGAALSAQALVPVPGGLRPLGALRLGQEVLDADGALRRLAAVHLFRVPPGFAFSPLRLRAGRLPLAQDLLAGPQLALAFAGDDVARLFGDAAGCVLVQACHLPDPVQRRALPAGPDFLMAVAVPEQPALLRIGGLAVACPGAGGLPSGNRILSPAETAALLADGGDMRLHTGAA